MKPVSFLAVFLFYSLIFIPQTIADLSSDKQALLEFASIVPHGRKLSWNSSNTICTSWVGITCNQNNTRVVAVRLPGVGLYGTIPENTLEKLDALATLSLRSNHLNGNIPSKVVSLPFLRSLYLQNNSFSGNIPSSLSPRLVFLDLSSNFLTGNIPASLQNLTRLTGLNLKNNSLTGSIPQLPPSLRQLNLSYNNLNGSVPSSLQTFPSSSFGGNNLLCGPPRSPCSNTIPSPSPSPSYLQPPPTVPEKPRNGSKRVLSTGAIIGIAFGGSAVLFLLLIVITLCCSKRKGDQEADALKGKGGRSENKPEDFGSGVQEAEKNKLVFFEGNLYNFDLEDLLRASAEVLGKGSYGTTYKAILDEGTTVVVKRLKELVAGKREFEEQMEAMGRISPHPNIVPLRAYYFSKDEKLLVCDYIPAGSFSTLLHGSRETGRAPLDWESRLKICLGAARSIAHIHSASGTKLVHGNIKSSNVLLTEDMQGCISDFGIAPLMSHAMIPSRTIGYRAPEVMETRKHTQKSDVYSFGVLLLETLTGKAPGNSMGQEETVDLPKWVQSVVREEWTGEVFDAELMKYQNIEEEMVQMLQIAMACVAKIPDNRPSMEEVVNMMEETRLSGSDNGPSPEDKMPDG